ncbi:MAG TPA: cohesin domain-containing protein [Candidatus Humimicrobiaceae bacterium]|nr:cohesin domain-containing protein [Candidatus Humimicrobiaceae bacterium]
MNKKAGLKLNNLRRISAFILIFALFFIFSDLSNQNGANAQTQSRVKLFLSPAAGSFFVGSTFDVAVTLDTGDTAINAVSAELIFPADKLQITSPSSGSSFVTLWVEQPSFSNTEGFINFSGVALEGIKTSSGIVTIITFRVIESGEAVIKFLPTSSVLADDGKGTEVLGQTLEGRYALKPKPPQGPLVFSETHPDETIWYNNNNPIISWEKDDGATDFSFILDEYPQANPDNTGEGGQTSMFYENLSDGLWYFHIKAKKGSVWGSPSHFIVRIDTTPPAEFRPELEFLPLAEIIGRVYVSFFTTDALSGTDHYEVAILNKGELSLKSPVFIESQSPYQLPISSEQIRVLIRATDKAGNARIEYTDASFPRIFYFLNKIKGAIIIILLGLLVLSILIFVIVKKRRKKPIINNPPAIKT